MDTIFLHDLRIETIVGVADWERQIRQTVSIDLEMGADIRPAAESDGIDDTLNYKLVAKRVQQFVVLRGIFNGDPVFGGHRLNLPVANPLRCSLPADKRRTRYLLFLREVEHIIANSFCPTAFKTRRESVRVGLNHSQRMPGLFR